MDGRLQLRELGPDDVGAVETLVEILDELRADTPWVPPTTLHRRQMMMRHGWDGEPGRHFLAHAGGPADEQAVGLLVLNFSDYDNLDLAWIYVGVRPEHRRQGHGAALLEAAYDVCRAMGRPLVGTDGGDSEQTRGFAAATGWEEKSVAVNRRQHVRELPAGLVERLHAEAASRSEDYELVRIAGVSPDELLGPLAEITAAINDAPLDDLEIEDEVFSAERIRAYEEAQVASGFRFYRIIARHRASAELAGHTVLTVDAERPSLGDQHDTSVVRAHRGHRLGQLLKADMLRWMAEAEPQLETVDTWNMESNDHMVGINEVLGYRIMGRELQFQRRLDAADPGLGSEE